MAKAEAAAPEGEKGGSKKNLILMAGIGLVLVGASIGGTVFFMRGSEGHAEAAEEHAPVHEEAIYHELKPPFHVNLMVSGRPRVLQAAFTVMARQQPVIDAVVQHDPEIRNRMLDLLSGQDYLKLQTDEGKQQLLGGLKQAIDDVLLKETGKPGVESVLFTTFIMQ